MQCETQHITGKKKKGFGDASKFSAEGWAGSRFLFSLKCHEPLKFWHDTLQQCSAAAWLHLVVPLASTQVE